MKYSLFVIVLSLVVVVLASAQTKRKSFPGEQDEEPLRVQSQVFVPERGSVEWIQKRTLSSLEDEESQSEENKKAN